MTSVGGICLPPLFGVVSDASNLGLASGVLALCGFATAAWTLLAVAEAFGSGREGSRGAGDVAALANVDPPCFIRFFGRSAGRVRGVVETDLSISIWSNYLSGDHVAHWQGF